MTLEVGRELIPALEKALKDYLNFSGGSAPADTKEFNAYHTACKAALLHVALLLKLTQKESPPEAIIPDISGLLEQAKKELSEDDFSGISVDLG